MSDFRLLHVIIADRIEGLCRTFHAQAENPLELPNLDVEPNLAFVATLIEENASHLRDGDIADPHKPVLCEHLTEILEDAPDYNSSSAAGIYWAKIRDALGAVIQKLPRRDAS